VLIHDKEGSVAGSAGRPAPERSLAGMSGSDPVAFDLDVEVEPGRGERVLEVAMPVRIGPDRVVWGTDFPHPMLKMPVC